MKDFRLVVLACLLTWVAGSVFAQSYETVKFDERYTAAKGKTLDIELDIDAGEVDVLPADSRDEVRVVMRYTEEAFREKVSFDEKRGRLRIQLDSRKWKKWRSYDSDNDERAEVTVYLPDGVDLYITSKISAGDISMELGGLRLKEFSFTNFAGEVEVSFDTPNKVVMDMLDINVKVGETRFLALGNARFRRADVNAGIGEMEVDFTGALEKGAKARVDLDIGEATVILPEETGVRARIGGGLSFLSSKEIDYGLRKRGRAYINDAYQSDEDALMVSITPGLGELNVRLQ